MEGNYAMQHIRQDIKTHESRKMGNNSIKNMPQDINQEKARQVMFVCKTLLAHLPNHTNEEWQYGNQCNDSPKN
jgi:hypothetical protein